MAIFNEHLGTIMAAINYPILPLFILLGDYNKDSRPVVTVRVVMARQLNRRT